MIYIENRRKQHSTIKKLYPNAKVIDLTSKSDSEYVVFSPFYPHGDIPVPYSIDVFSESVEGIWQGLKVFENYDIDISRFSVTSMQNLKRTIRVYGKIKGHRKGVKGTQILDYKTAREEIFIESYEWLLKNRLMKELNILFEYANRSDLVLLDYETNEDIYDISSPLSHAALVKKHIEENTQVHIAPIQTKLIL